MIELRINPETREIESDEQIFFGVSHDVGVCSVVFLMDKISQIDITDCKIKVNYKDAKRNKDFSLIPADKIDVLSDSIRITWDVPPELTATPGNVFFNVVFYRVNEDATFQTVFGTTNMIATVKNRFDADDVAPEQRRDLITHLTNIVKDYADKRNEDLKDLADLKEAEITELAGQKKTELEETGKTERKCITELGATERQEIAGLTDRSKIEINKLSEQKKAEIEILAKEKTKVINQSVDARLQEITDTGNTTVKSVQNTGTAEKRKITDISEEEQTAIEKLSQEQQKSMTDLSTEKEKSLTNLSQKLTAGLNDCTEEKKAELDAHTNESKAEIKAAGDEVLQSIPQDYQQTIEDVAVLDKKLSAEVTRATTVEATKATKVALSKTDRKLDALWKLNQGVTYKFEEDATAAYHKDVPSGAKMAGLKQIGGKTIVWNQLINPVPGKDKGITWTVENGRYHIEGTATGSGGRLSCIAKNLNFTNGHKYVIISSTGSKYWLSNTSSKDVRYTTSSGNEIISANETEELTIGINYTTGNEYLYDGYLNIFDLTQMFGAGKEPGTVEEFEAMFPAEYYQYDAGTLMSMPVSEIVEQGKNLFDKGKAITSNYFIQNNNIVIKATNAEGILYPLEKNTQYTIQKGIKTSRYYIGLVQENVVAKQDAIYINSGKEESHTFTTTDKFYTLCLLLRNYTDDTNVSLSDILDSIQIEKASTQTEYSPYHRNNYPIPQAILDLDGYGDSAGDVCNYVDFETKTYHKCVCRIDLESLTKWNKLNLNVNDTSVFQAILDNKLTGNIGYNGVICDSLECVGVALESSDTEGIAAFVSPTGNYIRIRIKNAKASNVNEFVTWLAENPLNVCYESLEQVTDISTLIDEMEHDSFEVEAGGTLTFKNSNGDGFQYPVPNTEEYVISLAEVSTSE